MFSKPNEVEVRYTCRKGNIFFDLPFSVPSGIKLSAGETILFDGFRPESLQGYNSITQQETLITFKDKDYFKVDQMSYNVNLKRNTWVKSVNFILYDGYTGKPYP